MDILLVEDDDTDVEARPARLPAEGTGRSRRGRAGRRAGAAVARRARIRCRELVIADLRMPRMGGLDLLRQIRHDPRLAHVPVVVVSSSRYAHDLRESYRLGANSFVRKRFGAGPATDYLINVAQYWLDFNELPPGDLRMTSPIALVIEDDPDFAAALEGLVKLEGFETRTARTLDAARKQLKEQQVDVILADLELPDGRGTDLIGERRDGADRVRRRHGPCDHRLGGRGAARRRAGLPDEAAWTARACARRSRTSLRDRARSRPRSRRCAASCASSAASAAWSARPRRCSRSTTDRARRADRRHGADHRRERHRQGARRPRRSTS